MPIYEYRCSACRKISSHLVLNRDSFVPICPHCGGTDMKKLVSRVHMRLSEETRMERLADPALLGGIDENDPKSVAKIMKKMGGLMDDDSGVDMDQMVEEAMEEAESSSGEGCSGGEGACLES